MKDAVFVPPHYKYVPELMSDLEYFFHNEQIYVPELVRIAIGHYQFETIHPFLDGNGRIGRLLIALYLVSRKILLKPSLYLSDFFERNKTLYYENLMRVRETGDMEQWLKFFMVGAIETAQNSIQAFKDIIALKEEIENTIVLKMGKRAPKARKLVEELYKNPVVNVQQVEHMLNVSKPTANSLIRELVEKNVLQELTGMKRNRVFIFYRYINLFSPKEIQ